MASITKLTIVTGVFALALPMVGMAQSKTAPAAPAAPAATPAPVGEGAQATLPPAKKMTKEEKEKDIAAKRKGSPDPEKDRAQKGLAPVKPMTAEEKQKDIAAKRKGAPADKPVGEQGQPTPK